MGKARTCRARENGGGAGKKGKGREKDDYRLRRLPRLSPVSSRFFFSCSRFLNSAGPTISEPGTGYSVRGKRNQVFWSGSYFYVIINCLKLLNCLIGCCKVAVKTMNNNLYFFSIEPLCKQSLSFQWPLSNGLH